jgi:hypothetical protein
LLPPKVVVVLTAIVNASLRLCHFPSRWKSATVIFIPKPGKNFKFPPSYRAISLLSSIGKVLEKVILTRLVKATDENSTIPDEQFGFRPKHSTVDQLINVTEFIAKGFGQKQSTGAIFLDVAKAFDTDWHDGLVYKLHAAGVPLAMVRLLNSSTAASSTQKSDRSSQPNARSKQVSHRVRYFHRLCTQSSLPTFQNPTTQKSHCMQTTLQF